MQHWHIKNKRSNDIICNWCYVIWFSPEMVFLPTVVFSLLVIITITCSNFSHRYLSCLWNNTWSVISWDFKILRRLTGTGKSFSLTRGLKTDIQERTSVSCSGVNCQHVKLYGFNTVWESLIWFQPEIPQTRAMRKLGLVPQRKRPPQMWEIYHQNGYH